MRALALLVLLAAGQASADQVEELPFAAPVTVAADGTVVVGDVEQVQGRLADVVRGLLAGLRFIPGRLDGAAVDSQVFVTGMLTLDPVADGFEPTLTRVDTQPLLERWRPADYPLAMLKARKDGVATLLLQVGLDGRVHDVEVVSRTDRDLARSAREAAADWRFAAQGGSFEVGATFWAHGDATEADIPDVACTVPAQLAHLPGDDGCMGLSETTGMAVRRGDPVVPVRHFIPTPAPSSALGLED